MYGWEMGGEGLYSDRDGFLLSTWPTRNEIRSER